MLMSTPKIVLRTRGQFERLFDTLIDPTRGEGAMFLLLAGYFATWSLYAVIAKSSHLAIKLDNPATLTQQW
jgi:hypothetical protein